MKARRTLAVALLVVAASACASDPIPPLPDDLRGMTEQEASCIACHTRGSVPPLAPGETVTPSAHPSFDPETVRTLLDD